MLPVAAFAERAQLSRRTIERKIVSGEIAADYVRRRGRRVFIDAAALATVAPDLSRHDATRKAAKPPESPPELISTLRESLRRERERADRAEARAEMAEQERREVQRHLSEATKGIILLQRQLTPPVDPPQPMTLSATPSPTRVDHTRRSTDAARAPSRRFSRWRFWVAH
ncbi:MAG TPA: hypothetical protein VLA17_10920 [Candidatus Limnocylindria bacterium]|nr:hypothetical protein [Candidatus Limnocylindria bacterium]